MMTIGVVASLGLMSAPAAQAAPPSLVSTVSTGGFAQQVAFTPNGAKAYVASGDRIDVINTANYTTSTVTLPPSPSSVNNINVSVSPDGGTALVSDELNNRVLVVNTQTNTVDDTIAVPGNPRAIAFSPDGTRIYVCESSLDKVSVIDVATKQSLARIGVGDFPQSIVINSTGTRLYVANRFSNSMSIIDTSTLQVTDTVNASALTLGVAISPNNAFVYVATNTGLGTYTVASNSYSYASSAGGYTGVDVSRDGTLLYATKNSFMFGPGSLVVLNASNSSQVSSSSVGSGSPKGPVLSPSGAQIYVPDSQSVAVFSSGLPTVTFDANGGTGTMTPQSSATATNLTANTFTRTGYNFTGWNTAPGGTGTPYANQASFPFTADDTLYAQWTVIAPPPPLPAAASPPGAPTSVSASPGNAQATVTWTPPADTGTFPIVGYVVRAQPGGLTCLTATTTCTVTGLSNGTAYTFTVTASSTAGNGPASVASAPVTPRTISGPPTAVAAEAGDAQATITWSPPADDGGSPITGYRVTTIPSSGGCTVTATTCTLDELTNGREYVVSVVATNAAGSSAPATATITPRGYASIVITGTRSRNEPALVKVLGTVTNLDVTTVQPYVRLARQTTFQPALTQATVGDEGRFRWQRATSKRITIYVEAGDVRSNAVTVPAR